MNDFEKLGVFYLGRGYDRSRGAPTDELILYDAADLVTHAVVIGMTGSGKTGLGVVLLEEAAIDGIPAVVIDPKGDLANLMLTFPRLDPSDFRPWVDEDEARRRGMTPDALAAAEAETWRKGLAACGQDGVRIARLQNAAECVVYTPGSSAGLPVSLLGALTPPEPAVREDPDLFRARISAAVSGLLGLVGVTGEPLRSREHVLLSTLLAKAWAAGQSLALGELIQQVQSPPVSRIGVVDLDTFFPAKERFELALLLNNLLAAPEFAAWRDGEPLDPAHILYTKAGKPRLAIFSIAHLGEAERMFFVTLLLHAMIGWMRAQRGTSSLRAVLYMDEVAGYLPPVAQPPSKAPLLTLLKQARAYGLGLVLATQNPIDLDYKALSNAGTWLLGRLQSERDHLRVLDGLEGAAADAGEHVDRAALAEMLASLGKRVFLLHNVHARAPVLMQTRAALSYLRGPMTREEIRQLMAARRTAAPTANTAAVKGGTAPAVNATTAAVNDALGERTRPVLPPDVPEVFLPASGPSQGVRVYQPRLLCAADVRFVDAKLGVDEERTIVKLVDIGEGPVAIAWDEAEPVEVALDALAKEPAPGAGELRFAPLPRIAANGKQYPKWGKEFVAHLTASERIPLWRSPSLGVVSAVGESERDFRLRLDLQAREARDAAATKLREKYAARLTALQDKVARAEEAVARESAQAKQQHWSTALSVGATILGSFLGRKTFSQATVGRATQAARGAGRSMKEAGDVARAEANLKAQQERLAELEVEFQAEVEKLETRMNPRTEALEELTIKAKKPAIQLRAVAVAWTSIDLP